MMLLGLFVSRSQYRRDEMSIKNRPYFVRADKWNDFLNHKTDDETLERCRKIDQMINQKIQQQIADTPTVDPETLPIVQKLREELARVTAERDAAVKDINEILSLTEFCPLLCEWCRWNEGCDSSKMPEWRGAKDGLV